MDRDSMIIFVVVVVVVVVVHGYYSFSLPSSLLPCSFCFPCSTCRKMFLSSYPLTHSHYCNPSFLFHSPWWWLTILNKIHLTRPNMLQMTHCANVVMDGFTLKNSPRYHIQTHDTANYTIRNIIIQVDTTAQQSLLEEHGHWEKGIPTFPLNTDGIDPAGINYLIENVTIDNYDDAVAVKPTSTSPSNIYANCSQNMLVRNSFVRHGVGMTIGSVPPHVGVNCVKDIVFRDIDFETPFKAIYVKTNPGTVGTGIIKNITYENIAIRDSIWWAIYIGPQQQKQPNGTYVGVGLLVRRVYIMCILVVINCGALPPPQPSHVIISKQQQLILPSLLPHNNLYILPPIRILNYNLQLLLLLPLQAMYVFLLF